MLKQNCLLNNYFLFTLPLVNLSFIFLKIIELNNLKISNNIIFFWLLTSGKAHIKKENSRLERGVRYYRFVINSKIIKEKIKYGFFDFITNKLFYLLESKYLRKFVNYNDSFFKITNLELFSNIRLSHNFFTSKINDNLLCKLYFCNKRQKKVINIDYMLKLLKL
jgi:hypothetical protein